MYMFNKISCLTSPRISCCLIVSRLVLTICRTPKRIALADCKKQYEALSGPPSPHREGILPSSTSTTVRCSLNLTPRWQQIDASRKWSCFWASRYSGYLPPAALLALQAVFSQRFTAPTATSYWGRYPAVLLDLHSEHLSKHVSFCAHPQHECTWKTTVKTPKATRPIVPRISGTELTHLSAYLSFCEVRSEARDACHHARDAVRLGVQRTLSAGHGSPDGGPPLPLPLVSNVHTCDQNGAKSGKGVSH